MVLIEGELFFFFGRHGPLGRRRQVEGHGVAEAEAPGEELGDDAVGLPAELLPDYLLT